MNKKEIFYKELERLKDKLIIMKHLPDSVLNKYNYNFNKIINKIDLLDDNNVNGKIYKLREEGYLNVDGYEKGYLFLFKGSSINIDSNKEKVHYKMVNKNGEETYINFCNIDSSFKIDMVKENTLIRTYKYIPSELLEK